VRALATLVFLLSCAGTAAAQELDVFDLNDFVAPASLGATFDLHGRLTDRGDDFRVVRITTGAVSGYAWQNTPARDHVGFLHLAASEYRGAFQSNVKLTLFNTEHSSDLPRWRAATQFAYYMLHQANTAAKATGVERIAGRLMITVAAEENPLRGVVSGGHPGHFNTDLAVELDTAMSIFGGRNASGSLVWVSRSTTATVIEQQQPYQGPCCVSGPLLPFQPTISVTRAQRIQRATYYYRLEDKLLASRYRIGASVGVGGEKSDRWRGATRVGLHGSAAIGGAGSVNVTWTPTFIPSAAGKRITQEVAIFLNRTLYARLGR
jgi:hypothetical protein